jgi:hypothetical protein
MIDLQDFAKRRYGEGMALGFRSVLRAMQAMVLRGDTVSEMVMAEHNGRAGVLVLMRAGCLHGRRRLFHSPEVRAFRYGPDLNLELDRVRKWINLTFHPAFEKPYRVGLTTNPPDTDRIAREIACGVEAAGGQIVGADRVLESLGLREVD